MRKLIKHILLMLPLLAMAAGAHAQINTEQVLRVGQNALYFEDYVLSIQYFNQVIQAKPYMAQPYLMRAIAKLNLDDYSGAEKDAATALELNPYLTDAWEVRGVARQNMGDNAGAITDYDAALQLLPRNRQITFNKALAQADEKLYSAADSTYSQLLGYFPGFSNGYLGLAKLKLETGDTIAASQSIEKALELNPNALNGYILRAAIAIDSHKDYQKALEDMDHAIKLEPRLAGLYINRAYLRYALDDYFGAMADYDYSLELESLNTAALFNRSLLLMEVGDNDRAYADLSRLLQLDPDDYRARYNRAVVNGLKRNYDEAISDANAVLQRFPDFSGAYYLRSEYERERGNLAQAKNDYDTAYSLAKAATDRQTETPSTTPEELTPEAASKKFNTLLTIDNDTPIREEYNNQAIRGRVQDRDLAIELEPLMELSFYSSPSELRQGTYYFKEVDDINSSRILRYVIMVVPNTPQLTDPELIQRHFSSIEYYNSYLATHAPRTIDYLGRAMDYVTVKDYEAAIQDLDKAIELSPDHPVAYFLRAQARYHGRPDTSGGASLSALDPRRTALTLALSDMDKAIELSPMTAAAWFDKGNLLYELGDYTSAMAAYTRAIELQPAMGEAYYNRGYIRLKLGNQKGGVDDLSKAGEMGIVSAYNLIKRITRNL